MSNLLKDIVEFKLENGLVVKVLNDSYSKEYYANLTVNYGSNDLEFFIEDEKHSVPQGIAHFLEHVMFHDYENDYFDQFSDLTANANAYTTYNQTSYLFSTGKNFLKSLEVLHEMITKLKSSETLVNKEREIISQELKMYSQMPDDILESTSNAISTKTNYKYDIGGTIESINAITFEKLKLVFDTFYDYKNMTLYLSGDFTKIDLEKKVYDIFNKHSNSSFERINLKDSKTFSETKVIENENIEMDMQKLSLRLDDDLDIKEVLYMKSLVLGVFSEINPIYNKLMSDGVLNESFYAYTDFKYNFNTLNFIIYDFKENFHEMIVNMLSGDSKELLKLGYKKLIASEIRSTNNSTSFMKKIAYKSYQSYDVNEYYDKLTLGMKCVDFDKVNHTLAKVTKKI